MHAGMHLSRLNSQVFALKPMLSVGVTSDHGFKMSGFLPIVFLSRKNVWFGFRVNMKDEKVKTGFLAT